MKKTRMVDKLEIHLTEDSISAIVENTYTETFPNTNSIPALTSQIHFLMKHWCKKFKELRVTWSKAVRTIFNRNCICILNLSAIAHPAHLHLSLFLRR